MERGKLCSTESFDEIESEAACKEAAEELDLEWGGTLNENENPSCFHADDNRNKVYFNTMSRAKGTKMSSNYAAICKGIFSYYYTNKYHTMI